MASRSGKRLTTKQKQANKKTRARANKRRKPSPRYRTSAGEYAEIARAIKDFMAEYLHGTLNPSSRFAKYLNRDQAFHDFFTLFRRSGDLRDAFIQIRNADFRDDTVRMTAVVSVNGHEQVSFSHSFSDPDFFDILLKYLDYLNVLYWGVSPHDAKFHDLSMRKCPAIDEIARLITWYWHPMTVDRQTATIHREGRTIRIKDGAILTDGVETATLRQFYLDKHDSEVICGTVKQ